MPDIQTLRKINKALEVATREKKRQKLLAEQAAETERKDEEATKLAMSMAMNERLIETLLEVRAEIAKGANISVNAPDVKVEVPEIKLPKIRIPEIKIPKIDSPVIPEIKIPKITVPRPEVTVKVPEIKIPKIDVPQVNIDIPDAVFLKGIDRKSPLPVLQVGADGKPVQQQAGGGGNSAKLASEIKKLNAFDLPNFDTQEIDETDPNNVVMTYSLQGVTVATKTISVSGSVTTIKVTKP